MWRMDTFPSRLRLARDRSGLSQLELARRIGVDPIVISRYERGKIMPHTERAIALSRELRVSIGWLLTGEGEGPAEPPDVVAAPSAA
jgi:transcriptional regulator with XRE-family HTH domain